MIVVVISFVFFGGAFLAYCIMKKEITFIKKVLYNLLFLLVSGALMLVTGIQETTLLTYTMLLFFTLLGILMRVIAPVAINFLEYILSKATNQKYEKRNYKQIKDEDTKVFFCILLFTTIKVLLYAALIMSAFGLI